MTDAAEDDNTKVDLNFPKPPALTKGSVRLQPSDGFRGWLTQNRISLVFNTYHIGKLFMIGVNEAGQFVLSDANFPRSMGLSLHRGTLWMASQKQIWRFENFLDKGQMSQGNDAVFAPIGATTTGYINLHDLRVSDHGVYFIACQFNCIGRLHEKWSFEPIWKPPFISEFAYGDRCHLNCLALEDGVPKYVTCFAETNVPEGWRALPKDQSAGLVIDVQSNDILCDSLHMPHSPQLHNGRLYVANSGQGEFGEVDRSTGEYRPICFVPGFTRGIAFWKNYALVGASRPRQSGVFEGNDATPLNQRLQDMGVEPECSISVINLDTGDIEHQIVLDGVATEIYDLCVLPAIRKPRVLDVESDAMNTMFRPSKLHI
ncbi:TIGR03032 family protein [Aliiroseovarius sediminilitoris]|uniref:TIGR03032 family protein n=1 Tax=Aliiroseovarius sediminilitoris TaxID=1173584 RepID=A0A1I0P870_9RHOB|nr:TIGR03032 family protein [Aliiroseovarius sediminilitoris]SEW09723.1 TIGR03032 family protein [Aliiroseovarius sediminilitoris]